MAPMAPVAARPPRAPGDDDLLLPGRIPAADERGQQAGDEEEDAVHDAEDPAGLEHGAGLIDGDAVRVDVGLAEDAQGQGVGLRGDAGAVVGADAAQVVDAGDEGADVAEVDEGDEVAVGPAAVVGEEGEDGPHGGEDGDDEEHEDGGRGEQVLRVVDVHEVGEHAERWDLQGRGRVSWWSRRWLRWGCGEGETGAEGKEEGNGRAYQSYYLHKAPKGEENSEQHGCGCDSATALDWIVVRIVAAVAVVEEMTDLRAIDGFRELQVMREQDNLLSQAARPRRSDGAVSDSPLEDLCTP